MSALPHGVIGDARSVRAAWDTTGSRAAVWLGSQKRSRGDSVGVIEPPSLALEVLHEWPVSERRYHPSGLDQLVWARDAIIVVQHARGRNLIEAVCPSTGGVRTLLSERSANPIWHVAVSPGGGLIGFDRFSGSHHGRLGTHLLDLGSGRLVRLTSEPRPSYHHVLVGFESDNEVIVTTAAYSERAVTYRLRFRL